MDETDWLPLLPWRRPFLMIDRLVDCVPGERITTRKNVTSGDPCVGGGRGRGQAFPAMLVLEGMGQSAALLFRLSYPEEGGRDLPLLGFLEASLVGSAAPGDALEFDVRSVKMTSSGGVFSARARVGGGLVAEAELAFKGDPGPMGGGR